MLFVLGMIGVFQMVILPGMLVLKAARFRGNVIQTVTLCFSTSLLANYLLVSGLCLLRIYHPWVVLGICMVEAGLALWLYYADLKTPLGEAIQSGWDTLSASLKSYNWNLRGENESETLLNVGRFLVFSIAFLLALDSLLWAWQIFWKNLGSVFGTWDAVISWNRWAVEWARGAMPDGVQYYPQLLPANWSLIYVILQNSSIQLFAKSIAPLFFMFTLLLHFDLGWENKSLGLLLGVTITRYLEKRFLGEFIADGYADIPVAFLGLMGVYLLLKAPQEPDLNHYRRILWFSATVTAAAAVTKQVGLFLLLVWPVLAYFIVNSAHILSDRKTKIKEILFPFFASLLVALPFYISRYLAIAQGLDTSNVGYLTSDIYHGTGIWERGMAAFRALDIYAYLFLLVIVTFWLVKPAYRWLTALVVIPFGLVWAFLFSYDTRNIALVLPLLGLVSGVGVESSVEFGLKILRWLRFERLRSGLVWVTILLAIFGAGLFFSDVKINARQVDLQKQIFAPQLNAALYEYIQAHGLEGQILTNYPINFLPGLEGKQSSFWYDDVAVFKSVQKQSQIGYLLIPSNPAPEIAEIVERKLANGEYKFIFENTDGGYRYRFIRIVTHSP